LGERYGALKKLPRSFSLYEIQSSGIKIYFRYSSIHKGRGAFFGLRASDLIQLEGRNSFICFLWNNQIEPLFVPYSDFEDIFQALSPVNDGQYKPHIFFREYGSELYIPHAGRFNLEGYYGWNQIDSLSNKKDLKIPPNLTHSQIQILLGEIGVSKEYDIWIPLNDRNRIDKEQGGNLNYRDNLPFGFEEVQKILQVIDVIWIRRGANEIKALFEVEHSTPIYSGLLRFNDIYLIDPRFLPQFSIVSNENRKSLFMKQLNRPTFKMSGLSEICTFLDYSDVYSWHQRLSS